MTNQDTRRAVQQIILQCEGGAPTEADAPQVLQSAAITNCSLARILTQRLGTLAY